MQYPTLAVQQCKEILVILRQRLTLKGILLQARLKS